MTYRPNQLPLFHPQMDAMKVCYHNPSMVATACGSPTTPPARYTMVGMNVTCKRCKASGEFQAFEKSHKFQKQLRVAKLFRKVANEKG